MSNQSDPSDHDTAVRHIGYGLISGGASFTLFAWATLRPLPNDNVHTLILTLAAVAAVCVVGTWVRCAVKLADERAEARERTRSAEIAAVKRSAEKLCRSTGRLHQKISTLGEDLHERVDALDAETRRTRLAVKVAAGIDSTEAGHAEVDAEGLARPVPLHGRSTEQGRR